MKILKKLFLVSLFCSLFVVSVNASNINVFSTMLVYSHEFENLITEKHDKIDLVKDYINNHNLVYNDSSRTFDIYKDKSVIAIDLNTIDDEEFEVFFLDFSDRFSSSYFEISYDSNSNYNKWFFGIFRIFSFKVKLENGSVSSFNSSSWGSKSFRYDFSEKPISSSVVLEINDYYFITDFLSEESKNLTISFNENITSNIVNVPLFLKSNNTTHIPPTQIRIIDLFDSMFTSKLDDSLNYLGTYENSNVLTYKINDSESGKDKELKLKLTFLNELDITENDIDVFKYGSQVFTQKSFSCSNVGSDSVCEFNLKYDVYDSISDKIMFDFKFNNSYNVKVEDSSTGNNIWSNYKDVEFEYKQINFKEISGAVFYLRNYDNYGYLSSYFDKDYFKFIISSGIDFFGRDVIYPNDLRYSNTYLYLDNNNNYNINSSNFININNFTKIDIPFEFDSSLLSQNKFSSFVFDNRNYLGSNDVDNQDIYIYYNSSLFNINKLKYSVIVDNGNTSTSVSPENDYDFIINGSQQTRPSGSANGGYIFEFDDEIKVQYRTGLEYFRDKIIDMFNLVSNFFNTMPDKFRICFGLVFVLLIGISIFRLLL